MLWHLLAAGVMVVSGATLIVHSEGYAGAIAMALISICWGLLVSFGGEPVTGVVQMTAGLAAAAIISLANAVETKPPRQRRASASDDPIAPFFRLIAVIMGGVVAFGLSNTLRVLPDEASSTTSFAWYWTVVVGMMLLLLGRGHQRSAYGLLVLSISGPGFYALLSPQKNIAVTVLGAVATITLSLLLNQFGLALAPASNLAGGERSR